jgi:hypothetical protein
MHGGSEHLQIMHVVIAAKAGHSPDLPTYILSCWDMHTLDLKTGFGASMGCMRSSCSPAKAHRIHFDTTIHKRFDMGKIPGACSGLVLEQISEETVLSI